MIDWTIRITEGTIPVIVITIAGLIASYLSAKEEEGDEDD